MARDKEPELKITSLPDLNNLVFGLKRGEMTLVASRTSHGKSLFLNQIAWDIADCGKKVLFLGLELSVHVMQERLFCNIMQVENSFLRRGGFNHSADVQSKWDIFTNMMNKSYLEYSDQIGRTWEEINLLITNLEHKPDVIIIDHINEISSKNIRDRRQAIDDYLLNIRALSIKHNFALVIGAQINRSGQMDSSKDPKLYQLKESGRLEESCDMAILLYWSHKDDDTKAKDKYQIEVAKNRNGETGKITAKIHPQYYRLEPWTDLDEISEKALKNNSKTAPWHR